MEDIVIIGFGGHAKVVTDSIEQANQYNIVGYTDTHERFCGYKYIGTDDILRELYQGGVRKAVVGLGYLGESHKRDDIVSFAKDIGYGFPAIIDPTAIISRGVVIEEGAYISKNVVINAGSKIGKYGIINTGSIIEHDNKIGDYTHVSVGVILCGEVSIGHHSMIGAGTTVIQGRAIGSECIVGANSTVLSDVADNERAYGVI